VLKDYYYLLKPGIIRGNILTLITGYLVGLRLTSFDSYQLFYAILGTSMVVGSACVLNNILDKDVDAKMVRTKNRALAANRILVKNAYLYAITLGFLGTLLLVLKVNILTAVLGLLGVYLYAVVYTYCKRKTAYSTLVGSLSGSIPPVAGYAAATGVLDFYSVLLFASMTCWQMPHFYAIALYRHKDYSKAGIPVLPLKRGINRAKISVLSYVILFIISVSLLFIYGILSELSTILLIGLSSIWLSNGIIYFNSKPDKWGKMMFLMSLIMVSVWCLSLSIDSLI